MSIQYAYLDTPAYTTLIANSRYVTVLSYPYKEFVGIVEAVREFIGREDCKVYVVSMVVCSETDAEYLADNQIPDIILD